MSDWAALQARRGGVPVAPPGRPATPVGPLRAARGRRRLRLPLLAIAGLVVWLVAATLLGGTSRARQSHHRSAHHATPATVALDPRAFSPGACVAMAPTRGNRRVTVFLDAGHGGIDPGAVGTATSGATVEEAVETLPIELDTAARLRADGYRVVVSRTRDTSVTRLTPADLADGSLSLTGAHDDVAARDVCADLSGAKALVGIYLDSGASAANAGSLTTWDPDRPFATASRRLAGLVQHDVLGAMNARGWGIPDAGLVPDSDVGSLVATSSEGSLASGAASYGHLLLLGPADPGYLATPTTMPGTVIEPLFVTDPFEASIAASRTGQAVVAAGIAEAVEAFLAPPRVATTPTT